MARIAVEQIVLGPRAGGRNFGTIATTPGLNLSASAAGELRDFNLRIGDYASGQRPVHTAFPISDASRELWAVASTWQDGEVNGNPVIITWALILNRAQLDAINHRMTGLFSFIPAGSTHPEVGAVLPVLEIDADRMSEPDSIGPALPDRQVKDLGQALLGSPIRLSLGDGLDPLTVISRTLALRPSLRQLTSFSTAPLALREWSFQAFSRTDWPDAAGAFYGLGGFNDGSPATPMDRAWTALLIGVEDDPSLGGTDRVVLLSRMTTKDDPSLMPQEQIRRRVVSACGWAKADPLRHDVPGATAFLIGLMRAAARIENPADRQPATRGVLLALEDWILQSGHGSAIIDDYFQSLLANELKRIAAEPLFMPRLAAEGAAALKMKPSTLAALGAPLVTTFASLLYNEAQANDHDVPESAETLLDLWLKVGNKDQVGWLLGRELFGRVVRNAASEVRTAHNREKIACALTMICELVNRAASEGPAGGVPTVLRDSRRLDLEDLVGETEIGAWEKTFVAKARKRLKADGAAAWPFAFSVHAWVRKEARP